MCTMVRSTACHVNSTTTEVPCLAAATSGLSAISSLKFRTYHSTDIQTYIAALMLHALPRESCPCTTRFSRCSLLVVKVHKQTGARYGQIIGRMNPVPQVCNLEYIARSCLGSVATRIPRVRERFEPCRHSSSPAFSCPRRFVCSQQAPCLILNAGGFILPLDYVLNSPTSLLSRDDFRRPDQ